MPVSVEQVVIGDVASGQTFVGTVMPARRSIVGSAVDGRVIEFLVNDGDRVEKDQPLARLRTETLAIQLAGAKADLELREHELAELKNGSRKEEIDQAVAKMLGARSLMELTLSRLERIKTLTGTRATTEDALQDAQMQAETASQAYQVSKAEHELVIAGPRTEKIAQAAARVAVQVEEIHRIEDLIAKHTMLAPFAGFVVKEFTEIGQWIKAADPVAEIVELEQVEIEIQVVERTIGRIQLGSTARVELEALPEPGLEGEVIAIVPQADVRSRSFPVKIRVANPMFALKPGMLARVILAVGNKETAMLVSKDALVLSGASAMVVVAQADGENPGRYVARRVPVELGICDQGKIQVQGDLKAGDLVIIEGNERVLEGQEVKWPAAAGAQ